MVDSFTEFEQQLGSAEPALPPPQPASAPRDSFAEFEDIPKVGAGEAISVASPAPIQGDSFTEFESVTDREIRDRSFFDRPALGAEETSATEIAEIARKHGVDPAELERLAPYFGARIAGSEFVSEPELKRTAGGLGQAFAFGVPQKLYKMAQDPAMERALDDIQALAGGRSSYLQLAGEVAAPVGGVAKAAPAAAKIAAGAGMGAVGGFGASRQDEELRTAALGVGFGLALGGAAEGVERLLGKRAARAAGESAGEAEEAVSRVAARGGADFDDGLREAVARNADADAAISDRIFRGNELTDDQAELIARTYAPDVLASGERSATEIADTITRNHANRLAEDVLKRSVPMSEDSIGILRSTAGQGDTSGRGTEYLERRLRGQLNLIAANKHLDSIGMREGRPQNWVQQQLDRLSDAQFVFRSMDERFPGLGAEDAHKKIARGVNQLSYPREDMRQQIRSIFRGLRRDKLDRVAREGGDLIQAVESGATLTPEQQKVYAPFRDFYARALSSLGRLADEAGVSKLTIKARDNYVPSQLADDLQGRIADRLQSIVTDASRATGNPYADLAQVPQDVFNRLVNESPEHRSTLKFLHILSGEADNTPAKLSMAWKDTFLNPAGRHRLETLSRAALEREDVIPMWARETDMYKLANKWITNTLRDIYLREGIDDLRNVTKLLRKRGVESEAEYGEKLLADLMGIRQGTVASGMSQLQQSYMRKLDGSIRRARSPGHRIALETARALPVYLQSLAREVYPNLLGALNPRTLIMNLTQTFTKTLPEFGGPYGSLLFLRGAARVGGLRNLPATMRRMEAMGLSPRRFVGDSLEFLDEGLMRTPVVQALGRGTKWLANAGMKPYELAESVNRGIAFGASEMMANDLLRGSKLAESALMRFPTSVRRNVERARAAGDLGDMVQEIATHVVNSTQYQYNRASMSEYGRTLGSLFSTFSKWPTATLGQTVEAYRRRGALGGSAQLAEQLVAPYLLLEGADYLLGEYSEEGLSDRQKKLFSASGLSQAAPIGTLKGIATGDFFTPPVIDTAVRLFIDPARSGDSEKAITGMKKAAENGLYMFAPGGMGGWLRFLTDDMVTLYTGERPEGSTQVERAGLDPFGREDD